ncbi:tRNA-guanine transglycosylase DpdA [Azospirillum isscasi]|uniref:tRNA-guanine transglycosylase DpdA n=1 Tax=Azospirillum isscasi TaxID=3053926 RepID=A0ABU0WDA6_9PROT|nr:tRNA-guanine transglycosylase DpdA [Azospirillum isscasi]MDQ2102180.1 tRNA-guanine transglycosylase DpdA [Azospirillum isscasi]
MRFIFADSLDMVDPGYDFLADRNAPGRKPYWDDVYPHEIMGAPPYNGILVSRGIVGDHRVKGKYTESQAMRFRRVGARAFLRLDRPSFEGMDLFGDCGAFTYADADIPPYEPSETAAFYEECGFTHGCSVDHIIFDFDPAARGMEGGSAKARERFDITLENARAFLAEHRALGAHFTPLGVVQGWSADSMAEAARRLVLMGYDYLAIGGMVPLKAPEIRAVLGRIREAVPASTRLHVLGFAKADEIDSFRPYRMTSFDTTSPLLRAFKDGEQNYYLPGEGGRLRYYTALRVPQSIENPRLQRLVKTGAFLAEDLTAMEVAALGALRAFDRDGAGVEDVLRPLLEYSAPLVIGKPHADVLHDPKLARLAAQYRRTLEDRPWKDCACTICRDASVEVVIFRASNRNKRRGIHNLAVYKSHIERLEPSLVANDQDDLFSRPRPAER